MLNTVCKYVMSKLDNYDRVRVISRDHKPYLIRGYIKHEGMLPGIYLHKFLCADLDKDLHDHPWNFAVSFILSGGYEEERYDSNNDIYSRVVSAGKINLVQGSAFHRIDSLMTDSVWTLFVPFWRKKDWGFIIRDTGNYVDYRTYLANRGEEVVVSREKWK